MEYITKQDFSKAVETAGISSGDTVLVYSDISCFGTVYDNSLKTLVDTIYNGIKDVIGNKGTICTPAYFFEYAEKGIPYDITKSPISNSLGIFPKYINSLDNSIRSANPITAITANGYKADYICEIKNRHSFGEDSAYDRIYKSNAKILLLGPKFNSMTYWHYVEYKVGVPHRYNKIYNIPVYKNGKLIYDYTIASVRYLNKNIEHNFQDNEGWFNIYKNMLLDNSMKYTNYLKSSIYTFKTYELTELIKNYICADPFFLIKPTYNFPFGEIPNDGPLLYNK